MNDDRTPEQILDLLIYAAGNADVVRLSALIHDAAAAGAETFTRPVLVDRWSARWTHHLTQPGRYRPEQRVGRSLPTLTGMDALSDLPGPEMRILDPQMVQFLAARVYMAEALDVQHPTSNTLPVGEATRAVCTALVYGPPDPPVEPETDETSPAVPVITPEPATP